MSMYETLETALYDEYNRTKDLLSCYDDVNSPEHTKAVQQLNTIIKEMQEFNKSEAEVYNKQELRRIEEKKNDKMVEIEQSKIDKSIKLEEIRNTNNIALELQKQVITKGRAALEIAKIVVPVVVPLFAYNIYQKRIIEFEENGRITSTAGRELHLPKIFNK